MIPLSCRRPCRMDWREETTWRQRNQQKTGQPPEPRFTPGTLLDGWRNASDVHELTFGKKVCAALDYARLASIRGITAEEYFNQYHFWNLQKPEQERFITVLEAQRITWKLSREIRDVFWNKDRFLTAFADFIHRDWVRVTDGEQVRFREHVSKKCPD